MTVPFFNYAYVGDPVGDDSLDRTREGYVEIIEMGAIKDGTATWSAVTHSKGTLNVPTCKLGDTATITSQIDGNTGGLFGTMTIINVLAGEDFSVDAVALEGFAPGENLYQPPGDVLPNLASGLPFALNILNDPGSVFGVTGVYSYWGDSIDAVSAVMMRNSVMNEFVLDTSTRSGTDWVVTMPTKRYYYDEVTLANGTTVGEVLNLFQRNLGPNGACDDVELTQYDREERTVSTPQNFSPPPPTPRASICWEANVITFNNSNVFASKNRANFVTAFQNGWVNMAFTGGATGLPQAGVHQLVDNRLADVRWPARDWVRSLDVQQRHADRFGWKADPVAVRRQLRPQVQDADQQHLLKIHFPRTLHFEGGRKPPFFLSHLHEGMTIALQEWRRIW